MPQYKVLCSVGGSAKTVVTAKSKAEAQKMAEDGELEYDFDYNHFEVELIEKVGK